MTTVLIFIAGIFFISVVFPFFQIAGDIIITWSEYVKSKINLGTTKNNAEMIEIKNQYAPSSAHAIGFDTGMSFDDYYDDEDYDDDFPDEDDDLEDKIDTTITNKNKTENTINCVTRKIGF